MSHNPIDRRTMLNLATGAVTAAGVLGATALPASAARQGNMEAALGSLNSALQSLQAAPSNKGGHKHRAIALIRRAMEQVQLGIDYANRR